VSVYARVYVHYNAQTVQPKQSRGASVAKQNETTVFSRVRNCVSDNVESRSEDGKMYKSLGALAVKLYGPKVTVLVARTCR